MYKNIYNVYEKVLPPSGITDPDGRVGPFGFISPAGVKSRVVNAGMHACELVHAA